MICQKCLLPETYPGIAFDDNGVCNYCNDYVIKENDPSSIFFTTEEELKWFLHKMRRKTQKYDVLVPLSGGVDSSAALINIVEKFKLRPLCFHNDHGFEEELATENVRKLCSALEVDLVVWQNDFRFMKKLWRYINEQPGHNISACYICGNMLYLNAIEIADKFGIPLVINGYSKGQADLIYNKDKGLVMMLEIIEVIRRTGDKEFLNDFNRKYEWFGKQKLLQTREELAGEPELDKVAVLPFFLFKFHKTDKEALRQIVTKRCDWKPLNVSYPKRTTNCRMIWLNIFADIRRMGYSVYTEEYSHLIRVGEITREQALNDLEFTPPCGMVEDLATAIGMNLEFNTAKQKFSLDDSSRNDINLEFDL